MFSFIGKVDFANIRGNKLLCPLSRSLSCCCIEQEQLDDQFQNTTKRRVCCAILRRNRIFASSSKSSKAIDPRRAERRTGLYTCGSSDALLELVPTASTRRSEADSRKLVHLDSFEHNLNTTTSPPLSRKTHGGPSLSDNPRRECEALKELKLSLILYVIGLGEYQQRRDFSNDGDGIVERCSLGLYSFEVSF